MVMYCAKLMGLDVKVDSDEIIGIPLETYIPEIGMAIEYKETGLHLQNEQSVKKHMLSMQGIRYITLKKTNDMKLLAEEVIEVFREFNLFLQVSGEQIESESRSLYERHLLPDRKSLKHLTQLSTM